MADECEQSEDKQAQEEEAAEGAPESDEPQEPPLGPKTKRRHPDKMIRRLDVDLTSK